MNNLTRPSERSDSWALTHLIFINASSHQKWVYSLGLFYGDKTPKVRAFWKWTIDEHAQGNHCRDCIFQRLVNFISIQANHSKCDKHASGELLHDTRPTEQEWTTWQERGFCSVYVKLWMQSDDTHFRIVQHFTGRNTQIQIGDEECGSITAWKKHYLG